ncbi:hypothetical protein ACTHQW_13780 [Dietzia maris]
MIPKEQVAHDLAIVYLNNKYGVRVTGSFSINSSTDTMSDAVREVTGDGSVTTEYLPDVDEPETVWVGTGERWFWGRGPEKKRRVPTGNFVVDPHFRSMAQDYYKAYSRFLELLDDQTLGEESLRGDEA